MKPIERPLYFKTEMADKNGVHWVKYNEVQTWFNTHIAPLNKLIEGAVEVEGADRCETIYARPGYFAKEDVKQKALLIGIEPIVKETAEDILIDIINKIGINICGIEMLDVKYKSLMPELQRAKALLESSE
jgi:hypothetical protein